MKILSWNVQGHNNLFAAITEGLFEAADVGMLQEANVTDKLRVDVSRMALRKGYHAFFTKGNAQPDALGRIRGHGGLVTLLVRQDRQGKIFGACIEQGQYELLQVMVGDVAYVNLHRKPGRDESDFIQMLQEIFNTNGPMIAAGDFNIHASDLPSDMPEAVYVRNEEGQPMPSRVQGHRCLDYYLQQVAGASYGPHVLGDHLGVFGHTTWQPLAAVENAHVLRPTTQYVQPPGADPAEWEAAQTAVWDQAVLPEDRGDTEAEWQRFNNTAEAAMRAASFHAGALRDPPQRRVKGSQPAYVTAKGHKQVIEGDNFFQVRRLRNLLGRLRDLCRQQMAGQHSESLIVRMHNTWPGLLGPFQEILIPTRPLQLLREHFRTP